MSYEIDFAIWVQILNKAIYITRSTKNIMNPTKVLLHLEN